MMDKEGPNPGPTNLGNPSEWTIAQLAEEVVRLTGSGSRIEYRPLPEDDPQQRMPDITRAKAELDWQPVTQLADGLRKTIEYFRPLVG